METDYKSQLAEIQGRIDAVELQLVELQKEKRRLFDEKLALIETEFERANNIQKGDVIHTYCGMAYAYNGLTYYGSLITLKCCRLKKDGKPSTVEKEVFFSEVDDFVQAARKMMCLARPR